MRALISLTSAPVAGAVSSARAPSNRLRSRSWSLSSSVYSRLACVWVFEVGHVALKGVHGDPVRATKILVYSRKKSGSDRLAATVE